MAAIQRRLRASLRTRVWIVSGASLAFLAVRGDVVAQAGGAHILQSTARVTFCGALAMALTAGIGALFGTVVQRAQYENLAAAQHVCRGHA